jgi:hypothetical protein
MKVDCLSRDAKRSPKTFVRKWKMKSLFENVFNMLENWFNVFENGFNLWSKMDSFFVRKWIQSFVRKWKIQSFVRKWKKINLLFENGKFIFCSACHRGTASASGT